MIARTHEEATAMVADLPRSSIRMVPGTGFVLANGRVVPFASDGGDAEWLGQAEIPYGPIGPYGYPWTILVGPDESGRMIVYAD